MDHQPGPWALSQQGPSTQFRNNSLGSLLASFRRPVFRNANLYTLAERTSHGTLVGEGRRVRPGHSGTSRSCEIKHLGCVARGQALQRPPNTPVGSVRIIIWRQKGPKCAEMQKDRGHPVFLAAVVCGEAGRQRAIKAGNWMTRVPHPKRGSKRQSQRRRKRQIL